MTPTVQAARDRRYTPYCAERAFRRLSVLLARVLIVANAGYIDSRRRVQDVASVNTMDAGGGRRAVEG